MTPAVEVEDNKIAESIATMKIEGASKKICNCESVAKQLPEMAGLPEGYSVRQLEEEDFHNGYLDCLAELTTVGEINFDQFKSRLEFIEAHPQTYQITVILNQEGRVIACGTLLVEHKFIHNCGSVGHIEDIVVSASQRGRNLGKLLVEYLRSKALGLGCYKVILDCNESNVKFYEKCEFVRKGAQMAFYAEEH